MKIAKENLRSIHELVNPGEKINKNIDVIAHRGGATLGAARASVAAARCSEARRTKGSGKKRMKIGA